MKNAPTPILSDCSHRRLELLRVRVSKTELVDFEAAAAAEHYYALSDWIRRALSERARLVLKKPRTLTPEQMIVLESDHQHEKTNGFDYSYENSRFEKAKP